MAASLAQKPQKISDHAIQRQQRVRHRHGVGDFMKPAPACDVVEHRFEQAASRSELIGRR